MKYILQLQQKIGIISEKQDQYEVTAARSSTRACFDGDRICAIGRCEPCQVGNQAALSRLLDVLQPIRSPSKQT